LRSLSLSQKSWTCRRPDATKHTKRTKDTKKSSFVGFVDFVP